MKQSEFREIKEFADKVRPTLVALVSEARMNDGDVNYAVDATLSLICIGAYGLFQKPKKSEPPLTTDHE